MLWDPARIILRFRTLKGGRRKEEEIDERKDIARSLSRTTDLGQDTGETKSIFCLVEHCCFAESEQI
jgi:hypothetical protein